MAKKKTEITLESVQNAIRDMCKYLDICIAHDCEWTVGGNGVNCSEAATVMSAVHKLVFGVEPKFKFKCPAEDGGECKCF